MDSLKNKLQINGAGLKWIAIITMFIDHLAVAIIENNLLFTNYSKELFQFDLLLRAIGRLAFPIFCFLLVEGFLHTRNVKKYFIRLLAFAIISEIPFNLLASKSFFNITYQNVYFTLAIGLATIWALSLLKGKTIVTYCLQISIIVVGMFLASFIRCDYDMYGVALIACMYIFKDKPLLRFLSSAIILCSLISIEFFGLLAFIPIHFYNNERGKQNKNFFYLFYPIHLLILGLISTYMF